MRSLVTLFLQLARTERSIQGPSTDNVRELFTVVEEAWEAIAAKKQVKLSFVTAKRCQGNFSPVLLATVMNNLVKNAVMYVSDGGRIEVIEKPDGFMVADNGPGIPPRYHRPRQRRRTGTFDCASHLRTYGLANPAT